MPPMGGSPKNTTSAVTMDVVSTLLRYQTRLKEPPLGSNELEALPLISSLDFRYPPTLIRRILPGSRFGQNINAH